MSEPAAASDDPRWPALFRRAQEPIFILNHRRRVVFANAAWEVIAKTTFAEAKTLTCTTRDTGHALAGLGRVMSPPKEVLAGASATVRRPAPGCNTGPPWWDIDFVPLMGDGESVGILGRIRRMDEASDRVAPALSAGQTSLRQQTQQRYSFNLWESAVPAVRRMVSQARLVASAACPAALVGERGTGKRSLARAIHAHSSRKEMPFVGLACDRLPADVVRATLEHQPEKIGVAYLHAPADLPRDVQVDLARKLVDKTHVLLGCPTEPASDLREGRLTEELWAAAATVVISVAPLRLRLADLSRLADSVLGRAAASSGRPVVGLTPAALENLRTHTWPDNLDELDEVLRTSALRCDQPMIDVGDLPLALREPPENVSPRESFPRLDTLLEQVEARMIRMALDRAGGNKTKAAEALGIWRPRLIRRMEALGIADTGE